MSKPMNSFFLYCNLNRKKMQDSNPNTPNSEITSILGGQWRCMSMAQKKIYKDMAQLKKAVSYFY